MKKCDYCGEEFEEYDLERRMFAKGRVKYICYKCRSKGEDEQRKHKVAEMERKKLIGEK